MNRIHCCLLLLLLAVPCSAGPLEDLAAMPDLSLFYQQLTRQQDIQMLLQGIFPQQQPGGMSDFTIFAPNNDAMIEINRRNEDLNLLLKYHIVSGRYDEQMLQNMAQEKYNQANPQQATDVRPQNHLPTVALPFQVFYGLGFYGGTGPQVNETYDNAGYGSGGISWLTHTSFNQTNLLENNAPINPYIVDNFGRNQNFHTRTKRSVLGNPNAFAPNLTGYFGNGFNPNANAQYRQNPNIPNMNYNPNFRPPQQSYGQLPPNAGIGLLRPTINNAFVLQSRPMSRGVINVIDSILWPPERRDQTQYKTAYDALEDGQFSRLRQLAERSDYFRSELRSMHHQTWFLPNDQAFASMGSSLSFLLDQFSINNTNDINEFIRAHVVPMVLYPVSMDSTRQVTTLSGNRWISFRKVTQPDRAFQVDVVSGRHVARILVSRTEEIRVYGNGVVYPISTILTTQTRSAADELLRSYQYFLNLVLQSGDMELANLLQSTSNQNMFVQQNTLNITILIPQQMSMQQLGNGQELSMNLRRHILRLPVYVDQLATASLTQQNGFQTGMQQQQPFMQPNFNQQQQQQQQFQMPQFQRTGSPLDRKLPRRRRQMNVPSNTNFQQQQLLNQPIMLNQQRQQQQQQQPRQFESNFYQVSPPAVLTTFQNGQTYPTLDPQFSVQAQISAGTKGAVVTLVGRSMNSVAFTATVLNSESNIPIRNGVMHVVRGILSGVVVPLDGVLASAQGASSFTQLLQQTRVIEQLRQSGRPYTLFIPTNAALQSMGAVTDGNRMRQFVLRHICADVLLDPMNNVLRRSAGFYSRSYGSMQNRLRQKRQDWTNYQRNNRSGLTNRQGYAPQDLGPGYFQTQQQAFGGYPAAPTQFGSNNQPYNPGYVSSNQPAVNNPWNQTMNMPFNQPMMNGPANGAQSYYPNQNNGFFGGPASTGGLQSCMSMSGERISVQSLAGTQAAGNTPSMSYQNFVVTCCGDQSVNSMVQSFNVYPPNFAIYLIGRPLLPQGQSINGMRNFAARSVSPSIVFIVFIISFMSQQIHQF